MIPVGENTYLMDTPGFSSLYISDMESDELKGYFREFGKYEGKCRFPGCSHIHEPDCEVKKALEAERSAGSVMMIIWLYMMN